MRYQIENGTVSLGGKTILNHIDFSIKGQEKIAVVGRNGAGKTTLLRLISGELSLDRDDKRFGKGITTDKAISIGFLHQQSFSNAERTVEEEILSLVSEEDIFSKERYYFEKEYDRIFTGFGFKKEDKCKKIGQFSGGEQTKLAFIKLLLSKPDILLLDEPTSFLDVKGKAELMDILQVLAHEKNVAVIVTLHELELAQRLADAVVCVAPSGVSAVLAPQDAFAQDNICALFGLSTDQYAVLFAGRGAKPKPQFEHYIRSGQRLLRCGYTTGTCAALGAAGAARLLLTGHAPESVGLRTPKGIVVEVAPQFCRLTADGAACAIVKDGGDDIDATTGLPVIAAVTLLPGAPRTVTIDGGAGVGRVTKPGLDQPVGAAAINRVPRQMITEALLREADAVGYGGGFAVVISIEGGEAAAKRTFNPHLGVEGGLSVLGTSGIVEPMSQQALLDTLQIEIHQAALKSRRLILAPGNYGLDYLAANYPVLHEIPVVKISNFIGEALDMAAAEHFAQVLLVGHVGKLVKLAGGIMNTHSRCADCRTELFCAHAALCGADAATCRALMDAATTDACLDILDAAQLREPVMASLLTAIQLHLDRRAAGAFKVGAVLFSNRNGPLGQTKTADTLLKLWKEA